MDQIKHKMTETLTTEILHCPLCNNNDKEHFQVLYSHRPEWEIMVCERCTFTFIPDYFLDKQSNEHYNDTLKLQHVKQGNNWVKLQRHKLRMSFLKKYIKQGKLLDVGAGWGHFLYAASQEGFATKGIEMDHIAAGYAQQELGLDVQRVDFRDLDNMEQFDVITMWDVLEHIENPVKIIEKCAELTKDNGYILIQVPQIDSYVARMQKQKWIHLSISHVNYFSRETVTKLFEEHGYEVLKIKSSFELKFVLTHSIAARLKRNKKENNKSGSKPVFYEDRAASPAEGAALFNKFTKVPHWILWCFVKAHNIIYNLLSAMNIGEEMMVIARKKKTDLQ
jgi:2-polyprenyl-3-methyl-5-hydroxy-6-metoxy-1,4-benzoquinol methylase